MGKFPNSQVCCRHLRPDHYHDSHCVAAALVSYDTRLSFSLIFSKDTKSHEQHCSIRHISTRLHYAPRSPRLQINAVVEAFENTWTKISKAISGEKFMYIIAPNTHAAIRLIGKKGLLWQSLQGLLKFSEGLLRPL